MQRSCVINRAFLILIEIHAEVEGSLCFSVAVKEVYDQLLFMLDHNQTKERRHIKYMTENASVFRLLGLPHVSAELQSTVLDSSLRLVANTSAPLEAPRSPLLQERTTALVDALVQHAASGALARRAGTSRHILQLRQVVRDTLLPSLLFDSHGTNTGQLAFSESEAEEVLELVRKTDLITSHSVNAPLITSSSPLQSLQEKLSTLSQDESKRRCYFERKEGVQWVVSLTAHLVVANWEEWVEVLLLVIEHGVTLQPSTANPKGLRCAMAGLVSALVILQRVMEGLWGPKISALRREQWARDAMLFHDVLQAVTGEARKRCRVQGEGEADSSARRARTSWSVEKFPPEFTVFL